MQEIKAHCYGLSILRIQCYMALSMNPRIKLLHTDTRHVPFSSFIHQKCYFIRVCFCHQHTRVCYIHHNSSRQIITSFYQFSNFHILTELKKGCVIVITIDYILLLIQRILIFNTFFFCKLLILIKICSIQLEVFFTLHRFELARFDVLHEIFW